MRRPWVLLYFAAELPGASEHRFLVMALLGGLAVGGAVQLAALCLCAAAPKEARARRWLLLLLACVGAGVGIVQQVMSGIPAGLLLNAAAGLLFCVVLGGLSVILMLRALARSQDDNQLGSSFAVYWYVAALCLAVLSGSLLTAALSNPAGGEAEFFSRCWGCWQWCHVALSLLLYVWWVRLLWRLRDLL